MNCKPDCMVWYGYYQENMTVQYIPLKPHFYIAKLGYAGLYLFLIFVPKHRLWVLVRTASPSTHNLCFEQKLETYQNFSNKIFNF